VRPDQLKRGTAVLMNDDWNAADDLGARTDDAALGANSFSYDWAHRLTSFSGPGFSTSVGYSWQLDGLLAGRSWGTTGDEATLSYDAARRPIELAKADGSVTLSQTYDRVGNVISEDRSLSGVSGNAGSNAQTFTYDPLRRLTGSSLNSAPVGYTYDLDGNRTRTVGGGVTSDYTYDRIDQLISENIGGSITAFAYDAYDNLTAAATPSATQTLYAYDLGDRLTSITPPVGSATSLSYDALGRIASRGSDTYSCVGTTETVWRIANGASSTSSAVASDGSRLAVSTGSDFGWLLPDLHGNVAAALNQAETAISSALRYDGYGQTIATYAAASLPTPWKYQGRLDVSPDTTNPLYEAGARYYSPAIGAFTQLDSYAGSAQNPLKPQPLPVCRCQPAWGIQTDTVSSQELTPSATASTTPPARPKPTSPRSGCPMSSASRGRRSLRRIL